MTVYDILMIDDDKDNFHSLKNYAYEKNVVLQYARTLQEGMEVLESNKRILGIILDGKGLLHKTQYDSEANAAFVHQALSDIRILEERRNKILPKCVLTAWYDNLKDSLEPRGIKVFDKKKLAIDDNQKQELFDYLMRQAKDSSEYLIRSKYSMVFRLMDEKYISANADNILYNCCLAIEKGNPAPSDFNAIRQLYELVIISLNEKDKNLIPDEIMFNNGGVNLSWATKYLGGIEIKVGPKVIHSRSQSRIPDHIHDCACFIKEITSAFSHKQDQPFTIYGYTSALFAWIEFFNWYTEWIDKRINN